MQFSVEHTWFLKSPSLLIISCGTIVFVTNLQICAYLKTLPYTKRVSALDMDQIINKLNKIDFNNVSDFPRERQWEDDNLICVKILHPWNNALNKDLIKYEDRKEERILWQFVDDQNYGVPDKRSTRYNCLILIMRGSN